MGNERKFKRVTFDEALHDGAEDDHPLSEAQLINLPKSAYSNPVYTFEKGVGIIQERKLHQREIMKYRNSNLMSGLSQQNEFLKMLDHLTVNTIFVSDPVNIGTSKNFCRDRL